MLVELLRCLAKESWKRKRDDGKAKEEKEGTTMDEEVLASLGGITEVVLGVLTIDLEASVPTERINMAPSTLMDIEVVEVASMVDSLTLPIIIEDEEVQMSGLLVFAGSLEPIIDEVAKEEEPIAIGLPMIKATTGVLPTTTDVLRDEVVREAEVLAWRVYQRSRQWLEFSQLL